MSMNEYIQYSQRQVDEIKTIGRRRAIIAVLVLGVVFIGLSYLFTNGFKEWPFSTYESLSIAITLVALLVALLAFMWQNVTLNVQMYESKQSIKRVIESNEQFRGLLQQLSMKVEQDQIAFRFSSFLSRRSSLVVVENNRTYQGCEVFEYLFLTCPYEYHHTEYKGLFAFLKGPGDGAYTKSESLPILTPYYSMLFELLSYIDSCSFITQDVKVGYAKMLKCSLSEFEILMLYYHGLMPEMEMVPFRKLIEKYNLLEGIDFTYLIADNNYSHYEESAFGKNGKRYSEQREKEIAQWPCNQHK